MPRSYLMSWEGEPYFRWVKMYKGTRYRVGCHELPITRSAWTKEGSAAAANTWWERKLAEQQAAQLAAHPHSDRLKELAGYRDAAKALGEHRDAEIIDAEIVAVRDAEPDDAVDVPLGALLRAIKTQLKTGVDVTRLDGRQLGEMFGDERVWRDRAKRITNTPTEKTIGGLVSLWMEGRRAEHKAGDRSAVSVSNLRKAIAHFERFVGTSNPPGVISYDLWERWYLYCKGKINEREKDAKKKAGWTALTAGSYFRTSRMFVRWLWERDVLTPPKNWNSTKHTFGRPVPTPPTFTNEEIKQLLDAAHGVHKLIILLMLNTGMTQQDVSDLRRDEIDLSSGRITRYRSKMKKKSSARLVSYKLWPETVELLKKYMEGDGDRALVTRTGQPWVWREITDKGERKSDNVRSVFDKLKKRAGVTGPNKAVKMFRKTSATRLKWNKEHADLRHWFLGHGETNITDRHYAAGTQQQLDAAVDWLRTQYDL